MINCKFSDVLERDMDLLFLEELASSVEFLNIFLSKIGLENADIIEVEQSKVDMEYGESDMTLIVEKDNKKHGILIENKIDAIAMPNQYGRYVERGKIGVKNSDYDDFFVFIVAPSEYLSTNDESKKYPHRVSYEECFEYFKSKIDARSAFKTQHIEQAINKQKHGYQVVEHSDVTDFWDKYITYKEQNYPQLWLVSKRGPKGRYSSWPHFNVAVDNMFIYHKAESGFVDLTVSGMGDKLAQLEIMLTSVIGSLTDRGITLVKTGKSAALRIVVPVINFTEPFDKYIDVLPECFEAVQKLTNLASEISTLKNAVDFVVGK